MRLLLLIGIVALHIAISTADGNDIPITYPDDDQDNQIPNIIPNNTPNSTWNAHPIIRQYALDLVTNISSAFAGKFVKEVAKNNQGNFVCSPISASNIMSMITFGTAGETKKQLRDILLTPWLPQYYEGLLFLARVGFQTLVESFADYGGVELRLANGIFLPYGFSPKPDFMEMITRTFRSEARILDFNNSVESSKIINEWCKKQTNNRIENIITSDDLDGQTALVLVNAVYFKGEWVTQFNPALTPDKFYVDGIKEEESWTMFSKASYNYGVLSDFDAHFVELPYKSKDSSHKISMFVILPLKMNGIKLLEENFDKFNVSELIRLGEKMEVSVRLPKFKIESEIALQRPLEGMGLTNIFNNPDFGGIVDNPRLKITKIVQKAFIEIDEIGTEAAAATAAGVMLLSADVSLKFVADHPFIAIIATTGNNPINLFTARYNGA